MKERTIVAVWVPSAFDLSCFDPVPEVVGESSCAPLLPPPRRGLPSSWCITFESDDARVNAEVGFKDK